MLDSDEEKLRLVEGKLGKFIENLLEYLDEDEGEEVRSRVIVGNKGDEVEFDDEEPDNNMGNVGEDNAD
ncbi:hypothetical protein V6N12_069540 [Hibiscus sabdariffa]|uniref:Uncharacterized protein n=1 Tax=Hibiscus sabdariffa TaxID=183260 RepID=A0ABR2FEA7_9ROSI